ncbi:V-type proton ATPase subunit e 2-like isoform X2 [Amphiura filiformis]|uniref:V-type proton ATPase subunit e 2-like isoform X2 n=1 Tax=Amphiura filiformis TaxID=82378 RepID=UPI003B215982
MASTALIVIIVTAFWGVIGIILPFVVPKRPDRGIIQTMLVLTAVCCYSFWMCTFIMQLNPLFGPVLHTDVIKAIQWEWDGVDS